MEALYRIAILGPESSGKTTLCRFLAKRFETVYVNEYVRGYLRRGKAIQSKEDLYKIACKQVDLEHSKAKKAHRFLFCDTELINLKVWSDEAFLGCDRRLLELMASHRYDLYLLLHPNLSWSHDGLRQGQADRDRIFEIYKRELEHMCVRVVEICALGPQRHEEAVYKLLKAVVSITEASSICR